MQTKCKRINALDDNCAAQHFPFRRRGPSLEKNKGCLKGTAIYHDSCYARVDVVILLVGFAPILLA